MRCGMTALFLAFSAHSGAWRHAYSTMEGSTEYHRQIEGLQLITDQAAIAVFCWKEVGGMYFVEVRMPLYMVPLRLHTPGIRPTRGQAARVKTDTPFPAPVHASSHCRPTFGQHSSNAMPAAPTFAELLRQGRTGSARTLREVAEKLKVDVSLVSKWERGVRKPTRKQVEALAKCLNADAKGWLTVWLRDKVLYELQDDELALEALNAAEAQVAYAAFNKQDRGAILRKLKAGLSHFPNVRKAWIFGSFARKDDKPGSDIDLAIEVDEPFSYFALAEVQYQLEQRVGRKVDVGFMDSFLPYVREHIEKDLKLIHARPEGR